MLPFKSSNFFGSILRGNSLNALDKEDLQANELAMLSNIGDISEDLHTYRLEEHERISLPRRSSFKGRVIHAS